MVSVANMIYKAAIKEVGSIAEANGTAPPVVHPYQVALGMIYLQQVREDCLVGVALLLLLPTVHIGVFHCWTNGTEAVSRKQSQNERAVGTGLEEEA